MSDEYDIERRRFLKKAALVAGATPHLAAGSVAEGSRTNDSAAPQIATGTQEIDFPRVFRGRQLSAIAFPLGGLGTGSISLGGRGNLLDWEIFNRPDKGNSPAIVLPLFFAQTHNGISARVIESKFIPPYPDSFWETGGSGLPRFAAATFIGSFPFARIQFLDPDVPVQVELEAFSPFIPLDADESGLPVVILNYKVTNPTDAPVGVSIGYCIDNPLPGSGPARTNEWRTAAGMRGLFMRNTSLAHSDPLFGSFSLAAVTEGTGKVTGIRGWSTDLPLENLPTIWDNFSSTGELGAEPSDHDSTGSLSIHNEVPPGSTREFTFLLAWHFPNRTPERCGWGLDYQEWMSAAGFQTVKELSGTVIGNYYCTRFKDAWSVIEHVATHFDALQRRTRRFEAALCESTLPAVVLDAATANLSTLVTNTCFRTADGLFHGFEGSEAHVGNCSGNCTHVWNYEAALPHLFPQLSRGLRDIAFGFCTDERGLMDHREVLPPNKVRLGIAAADGQMGAIIKLYLDWRMSGDTGWLRQHWAAAKRALEFAWIPGGWDADRDGVMEGPQLNTYDVLFFGPNPLMASFYLGALRAAEEMARILGDEAAANEYRRVFTNGSQWIDRHLFNGKFYVQQVRGMARKDIPQGLTHLWFPGNTNEADTENPIWQLGTGCLTDQLCGQYLAHLAGLGHLLDSSNIRTALESIHQYNYKPAISQVQNLTRAYAIDGEGAVILCSYGRPHRPREAFYYADEALTGVEYAVAAAMIFEGFTEYGVEAVANVRRRHDGEKRNPWNEPEAGNHYARAMSSWGVLVALSGFSYHAAQAAVVARPRISRERFVTFWSTGTGWGLYKQQVTAAGMNAKFSVLEGELRCCSIALSGHGAPSSHMAYGTHSIAHEVVRDGDDSTLLLHKEVTLRAGDELSILL